jgi:hypothetical protein
MRDPALIRRRLPGKKNEVIARLSRAAPPSSTHCTQRHGVGKLRTTLPNQSWGHSSATRSEWRPLVSYYVRL